VLTDTWHGFFFYFSRKFSQKIDSIKENIYEKEI